MCFPKAKIQVLLALEKKWRYSGVDICKVNYCEMVYSNAHSIMIFFSELLRNGDKKEKWREAAKKTNISIVKPNEENVTRKF